MSEIFLEKLPERFVRNALGVCGKSGEEWLNNLPEIIRRISEKWSLKIERHFPNLSYNYVAPCICEGDVEAVLKIGLPEENPEIFSEANFLQTSNGAGAVKLLKFDKNHRALLLEKLTPGKHLKEIFRGNEMQAVETAIDVMRKLRRRPLANFGFRRLEDWFQGFDRARNTRFPQEYIEKARKIFCEANCSPSLLLHGDLHHENILSAIREKFLAIDPKGIVGDIGYEIAVFLNNHRGWLASEPDLPEKLNHAVRKFSEAFAIEPQKLKKWAYAQIVLSAWWTFEENGENWQTDLKLAEIWESNAD